MVPGYNQNNYTPRSELYGRIARFQECLRSAGIGGALIMQNADLFYFSGTCQDAHLLIPAQGEPLLLVRKSFERALEESALDKIVPVRNLEDIKRGVAGNLNNSGRIGLELDVLPANLFFRYKRMLEPLEVVDASELIRKTRMIKTPYEIERLKESARLSADMFCEVPNLFSEGMTEIEFAGRIDLFLRERGHQGKMRVRAFNQEAFMGHLLTGWNSACPSSFNGPTGGTGLNPSFPQSASSKKIGRNEPILVDYATIVNGYIVDQTRIFSIGSLSGKLVEAHNIALEIKRRVVKEARPGVNGKDIYDLAIGIAGNAGLAGHFMGYGNSVNFIAHGIGLELDELPIIAKNFHITFRPGMVLALEPKFIFPGEGTVGVEDTFVMNENGLEQITLGDDSIYTL